MLVTKFNQDIVPSGCMISPQRRNHGHSNIRASITLRSRVAACIGPPRVRYMSRFGAQPSWVEPMVAGIQSPSGDRLCRAGACATYFATQNSRRSRTSNYRHPASAGSRCDPRDALRFDRRAVYSRQTGTARHQTPAERGDDSTRTGQAPLDASAGSQSRERLLSVASGLGALRPTSSPNICAGGRRSRIFTPSIFTRTPSA
jgi:hypothetical protein